MALQPLKFRPGVNKDVTNYAGEGGWVDSEKIRFRSGHPQKLGGWTKYTPATLVGVCRQIWNYATTFSDNFICFGTHKKVYMEIGGALYDITPIRQTFTSSDTDNSIETIDTSTIVTGNITSHGAEVGDYVTISGVSGTVGGIPDSEINAEQLILTVPDADSFTFEVSTAATSTVAAGGGTSINMAFQINVGSPSTTEGYGWGTDTWNSGAWGLGSSTPVLLPQRDWWFSHIDNDLIFSIRNGAIYYWVRGSTTNPTSALGTRGVTMQSIASSNGYDPDAVPVKTTQILVSQNDQHLIAFGAVPLGSTDEADFDSLLIRWASQDAPSQWTPAVTNSAGSIRLSRGSKIMAAYPTRQEILVWTDSNLNALKYLGTTDVFGIEEYADFTSIMSPRAMASANDTTYWMGRDKFYYYNGRVQTLKCTLRTHVFQDMNINQADQVICGTNEEWSEVWWFYTSETANWNDRYVVYNYLDDIWYHGTISRTAWMDSSLKEMPIAVSSDSATYEGTIYNHEDGLDADGSAMNSYITSNDFDMGDGERLMLSRRIIPDLTFDTSTATEPALTLQVQARNFPGLALGADTDDTQTVTQTVGVFTRQVFIRARGRQMTITVESEDIGVHWRLGHMRLDVRQDGRQ